MNKEDNIRARQMAEEAIALEPRYPTAYIVLGFTHINDIVYRSSESPEQSLARVVHLAHKILALDESSGAAHALLGFVYLFQRQHEEAIAEMKQALALRPNSARMHLWLGRALFRAGRPAEAIQFLEKVLRLNPMSGSLELQSLGEAYIMMSRYDEAIAVCKKAIKIEPSNVMAHIYLTSAYSLSGREQEARAEAAEVLIIQPRFSVQYLARILPFKNKADTDRIVGALGKAGLK
jgi:tetratricopeptide (TPR) repeat protein